MADDIVQKISSDSIALAGLRQNNNVVYFSLAQDGSSKEVNVFSANELYKVIMSHLPNLQAVSHIAQKISIGIHNRILYGYDFGGYELTSPFDFIKIKANEITYTGTTNCYPATYNAEHVGGNYKGFPIYVRIDDGIDGENMPLMDETPIIIDDEMGVDKQNKFVYWVVNKTAYRNPMERHPVRCPNAYHRRYETNDFDIYIRVCIYETQ